MTGVYTDNQPDFTWLKPMEEKTFTQYFMPYKACLLYTSFAEKGIESDIFYIDLTMEAPVYCAPLRSKIQFTDYYPKKLEEFGERCQHKLDQIKARIAV